MPSTRTAAEDVGYVPLTAVMQGRAGPVNFPRPETVLEASAGWQPISLCVLWRQRQLLYTLVWRDVKGHYKQTAIGAVWAILKPLLMMLVFTLFVGPLVRNSPADAPYPVFVYTGLLAWGFFAMAIGNASMSVVASERLISKAYFPRLFIPFAAVGANLVDLVIASVGLVGLLLAYGIPATWNLLLLPLWLIPAAIAAAGVGTLFAALNVKYRDFRQLVPFIIQMWFFATPAIFIPAAGVPASLLQADGQEPLKLKLFLGQVNPMTGMIEFFRAAALGTELPWTEFAVAGAVAGVLFLAGCYYFRRIEDSFVDII
jgi:lipopolysaccharide transport system permease protein